METTRYFREEVLIKRPYLKMEWIEAVLSSPAKMHIQDDGRVRYWGFIPELGRALRVVTAFPDRDFLQ